MYVWKESSNTCRYRTLWLLNNNSFLPLGCKWLLHFLLLSDPQTQADPAGRGVRVSVFRCGSATGPSVRAVPCRAEAIDRPLCLLPIFKFSAHCGTHLGTSSNTPPAGGAQQAAETLEAKTRVQFNAYLQGGGGSKTSVLQTGSPEQQTSKSSKPYHMSPWCCGPRLWPRCRLVGLSL